jgi:hypothetical protein
LLTAYPETAGIALEDLAPSAQDPAPHPPALDGPAPHQPAPPEGNGAGATVVTGRRVAAT